MVSHTAKKAMQVDNNRAKRKIQVTKEEQQTAIVKTKAFQAKDKANKSKVQMINAETKAKYDEDDLAFVKEQEDMAADPAMQAQFIGIMKKQGITITSEQLPPPVLYSKKAVHFDKTEESPPKPPTPNTDLNTRTVPHSDDKLPPS